MPAFVSIRPGLGRTVSQKSVRDWAERMLRALELDAELSILITNDEAIHELNRIYRHRDRPTDVLAFAMREGEVGPTPLLQMGAAAPEILGDIVVSVETARRQARERGRALELELRMLLAHGLLHLVGYDHQTKSEERVMTAETKRLCRAAVQADAAGRPRRTRAPSRSLRR